MVEDDFTAILHTNLILGYIRDGSISFEDAARQLYYWTKKCPQARLLIPAESLADLRLKEMNADRAARGVDLYAIDQIGLVLYQTVSEGLNKMLISITSLGKAKVSVEKNGNSGKVYIGDAGLSSFANLENQTIQIATKWPGEHIDNSVSNSRTDCSVYVSSDSEERCVTRWIFGNTTDGAPQEIHSLISSAVSLANNVIASCSQTE